MSEGQKKKKCSKAGRDISKERKKQLKRDIYWPNLWQFGYQKEYDSNGLKHIELDNHKPPPWIHSDNHNRTNKKIKEGHLHRRNPMNKRRRDITTLPFCNSQCNGCFGKDHQWMLKALIERLIERGCLYDLKLSLVSCKKGKLYPYFRRDRAHSGWYGHRQCTLTSEQPGSF